MSIPMHMWDKVINNYKQVKEKVKSILGFDAVVTNHYGHTLLYDQHIGLNTPADKIIEIRGKFVKLYSDIKKIFEANGMEIKDEYFSRDCMMGTLMFLQEPIDIYKGIKPLENTINSYIKTYKKVISASSEYNDLGPLQFYQQGVDIYILYGSTINSKTSLSKIKTILKRYSDINCRINKLLKRCKYKKPNQLHPLGDDEYMLFSLPISNKSSDEEIINIIGKAKTFENNIKKIMKELNLRKHYYIQYNYSREIMLFFGYIGQELQLNTDYNIIKRIIIQLTES